jgi:hypothetical protein
LIFGGSWAARPAPPTPNDPAIQLPRETARTRGGRTVNKPVGKALTPFFERLSLGVGSWALGVAMRQLL